MGNSFDSLVLNIGMPISYLCCKRKKIEFGGTHKINPKFSLEGQEAPIQRDRMEKREQTFGRHLRPFLLPMTTGDLFIFKFPFRTCPFPSYGNSVCVCV